MLNICPQCCAYRPDRILDEGSKTMRCPECGATLPLQRLPLFLITGASGVGKSSVCRKLYLQERDYLVMESDIMWCDAFNEPESNYRRYRELWLRMCKNISQGGRPVVLCGCCTPDQFEPCVERRYFTNLYYLALVSDEEQLIRRLQEGRGIHDPAYIEGSVNFNRWLRNNARTTQPALELLDLTGLDADQGAQAADAWIRAKMHEEGLDG